MNIFVTDEDPAIAAKFLPDKLVVKMPTESMQMLAYWTSTRGFICKRQDGLAMVPYRMAKSHANHPCTKWVLESPHNGFWLYAHALSICHEYTRRYSKIHAIERHLIQVWDFMNENWDICLTASWKEHTPFTQCVPSEYKREDPIQAYRDFMIGEKGYATWRYGNKPDWWDDEKFAATRIKYEEGLKEKQLARNQKRNEKWMSPGGGWFYVGDIKLG